MSQHCLTGIINNKQKDLRGLSFEEKNMADKKLGIIASKGTLDWAYPPFILASTAAALGYETQVFLLSMDCNYLKRSLISK